MHLAFLSNEYPPLPCGGIGTSVQNLARALVQRGHRVTVVGWGPEREFADGGVRVRFLGHTRWPRLGWVLNRRRAARELNRLVRDEALAMVEAPDWCGPSAGMRLRCPLAVRCHGSATYFAHLEGTRVSPWVRFAERSALRGATVVAAVSRYCAERTAALFGLAPSIPVIPNGIQVDRFAGICGEGEAATVLYLGTLVRKKGVPDLAPFFNRLARQVPAAALLLAGRDNPDRATRSPSTWGLVADAVEPAFREQMHYLGVLPPDAVPALLRRAAVCVFPSYGEAFPVSWLEAMAAGRAVVAYAGGWAGEVITDGRNGQLVPTGSPDLLADAVAELLRNPQRRGDLARQARERAQLEFSADVVAQRLLSFCEHVIRNGAAPRTPA